MSPLFVHLEYFRLLGIGKPIQNNELLFLLPCSFIPCLPPQDIWGPLFVIYIYIYIFVIYFNAEYVVSNMFMVTINSKSDQSMPNFNADTCK